MKNDCFLVTVINQNYIIHDTNECCFLGCMNVLFLLPTKAGKGLNLSPAYLKIKYISAFEPTAVTKC